MSRQEYHPQPGNHPWELIYARDGRVFTEHLPALDEIAQRFTEQGCRKVMDLGCGNGRHLVALSSLGFQVIGLDISHTGLALSFQWLEESQQSADLIQSDTRRPLPLRDNCLDGLLSTQVIHHALETEVRLAIKEIHRVLKPGGIAFVTVPCQFKSDTRSKTQQIEEFTVLPLEGREAGLPHYIFSEDRLLQEFRDFENQQISYRDQGRILALWVQKPF